MRLFALLCLCLFAAAPARAVPAAAAANAEPLTWPDRGPYQKVGVRYFDLGTIKMPAAVVAAVRRQVGGRPSTWRLVGFTGFSDRHHQIVSVLGEDERCMSLLVTRRNWTNLSALANLPLLNEVLDPLVPADLQDHGKTAAYLLHVVKFQQGLSAVLLDPAFWREQSSQGFIHGWLNGTEKSPQALHALCRKWTVAKEQDRVIFSFNSMDGWGGVECWTVHLRMDKAVRLEGFEAQPVRENGTFCNQISSPTDLVRMNW